MKKIPNKVKSTACFVFAVLSLMLAFAYVTEGGNSQGAATNFAIGVMLLYGGFSFKSLDK